VQKNFNSDGMDRVLDCGVFQIDTIDGSGPPTKVSIKAGSIPYTSTIRTQAKTKAWEQFDLAAIANEIASVNGMKCMFESAFNPFYNRKEQVQESDITFLQRLCKNAGISLKVTAKMIVLFDAAEYEGKAAVRTIAHGASDVLRYTFGTSYHDTAYSSCRVKYTDPATEQTFEATYTAPEAAEDGSGQVLEVNEKVSSNAEALTLAEKRLREKNSQEYKASFDVVGDALLVAGLTVEVSGFGFFNGKYIIETATHSVSSSGYKTGLALRRVLEGY
jgi:phage protein D